MEVLGEEAGVFDGGHIEALGDHLLIGFVNRKRGHAIVIH